MGTGTDLDTGSTEESLNLDPSALHVKIRFRRSPSPAFKDAVLLAQELPGYRSSGNGGGETHEVEVALNLDDHELWERVRGLVATVGHWKRSEVALGGAPVENFFVFEDAVAEVRQCFERRRESGLGEVYCSGRDAPDDEPASFGCRLAKGVSRDARGNSCAHQKWFQFGRLSEDRSGFTVAKGEILRVIENRTARQACTICPAFDWDRVRGEVAELPDTIELGESSPFEVKFSEIAPSKPLGIRLKERTCSLFGASLGFPDNDEPQEGPSGRNVPCVRYSDVAAQDAALEEVKNVVQLPLRHPEYFSTLGVEPQRGVILYGPPGNGKSLIAKAVATESDAHLETINGPEILSKWVGESEENLRKVFKRARELEPSVILIDEIDALVPNRDAALRQHEISLISQLLVLLDGLEDRGRVAVIATTNRIEAVDPAVRRPGRFDYHIEVPLPDANGRRAILETHLRRMKRVRLHFRKIVKATDGFSGADLAAVCREAGLSAIRRGLRENVAAAKLKIEPRDLERALEALRRKRIQEVSCARLGL